MSFEVKVPILPESVADATIAKWYKKVGDTVVREENLVDLETDKIMLEVPAPCSGIVSEILFEEGGVVDAEQVIAVITEGEVQETPADSKPAEESAPSQASQGASPAGPSVRRHAGEAGVNASTLAGTGNRGRLTKADVDAATKGSSQAVAQDLPVAGLRTEKRVPMSRLRQRIAERLVQVQHEAAILTTFNEVDMKPVMELRSKYKESFEKKHGARLGFMSFFVKAVVEALQRYPAVNASIDGTDILYHDYCDIGVAIGSPRGLVVPVLRNVEAMSMADVEGGIMQYAVAAKDGKLTFDDLTGGTFSITNGGTFGSMMSTPIINPPQTAILGMHNIVKRAVVINDEVVVRPMMYVALSYDHRVIDGREAVLFLSTIKQLLEDPARMLLSV